MEDQVGIFDAEEDSSTSHLNTLSDEVLLMIFQYLRQRDLFNLFRTCRRLEGLLGEKRNWINIDDLPDDHESLELALRFVDSDTQRVKLIGDGHPHKSKSGFRTSINPSFLEQLILRGDKLTQLYLINQQLDSKTFKLHQLPSTLRVLHMSRSFVQNVDDRLGYFKDISLHLKLLENLDFSYCTWVSAHSLMSISKFPVLQRLNLKGCRAIGECLAYVALSSRFGFPTLKVLDVTDTLVGSSEFTAFAGIPTLEEFYFGQYDQYVDHQYNYISDLCFARIRNSTTLKVLDMTGSRITDASLEVLRTLPNLKRIDAHFTRLTQSGMDDFHRRMPNCKIYNEESIPLPPLRYESVPRGPSLLHRENVIQIFLNPMLNNNND